MSAMGVRRLLLLLALAGTALAADGIEVLSHTVVGDGIEVLCASDLGARVEAQRLVGGTWVRVDVVDLDAEGLARVWFPDLEPGHARILLRDHGGETLETLLYAGGLNWIRG